MSSSRLPASTPPGVPDVIDDKLSSMRSGDEAADRIYRRLMARRRRLVKDELIVEPEAAAPGGEPVAVGGDAAGKVRPPPSEPLPVADPVAADLHPAAMPPQRAADVVPPVALASATCGGEGGLGKGRDADTVSPSHDAGPAGRAGEESGSGGFHEARRSGGPGGFREGRGTGGAGDGTLGLAHWQPRSHTVRFIKEHPRVALAIGVPAVLLLARRGRAARALRYATSPAGMDTIRRISTVATALGLLERTRR